ncbi:response regulator [Muricauda sp. 334s03]|uniref:Response regulator n=1 Tax=Flagellimonas yonaguniensis TaxID=3031325 RepID=A0ABT5XY44_9FLAO|nr:response regulator [[Muricauda] yonaguniensis]MDF0716100.1 response regulator [[Muricauda] yonaguniensis]
MMNKLGLLIDDDPIFNWVSTKLIEKVDPDLTIKSCADGREALDFLCENYTGETFYHILLDINMPRMNGWEFIEALGGIQTIKGDNISIHIVSSSTDETDIKKADGLKFVRGYVKKPLSIKDVESIFG